MNNIETEQHTGNIFRLSNGKLKKIADVKCKVESRKLQQQIKIAALVKQEHLSRKARCIGFVQFKQESGDEHYAQPPKRSSATAFESSEVFLVDFDRW